MVMEFVKEMMKSHTNESKGYTYITWSTNKLLSKNHPLVSKKESAMKWENDFLKRNRMLEETVA